MNAADDPTAKACAEIIDQTERAFGEEIILLRRRILNLQAALSIARGETSTAIYLWREFWTGFILHHDLRDKWRAYRKEHERGSLSRRASDRQPSTSEILDAIEKELAQHGD